MLLPIYLYLRAGVLARQGWLFFFFFSCNLKKKISTKIHYSQSTNIPVKAQDTVQQKDAA